MPRRCRRERRAAAAVELAVLLPLFMFFCCIAVDYARVMSYAIALDSCARAGAMYASDPIAAQQSPHATTSAAALAEAPGLTPAPSVAEETTADVSGQKFVTVTVTGTFQTLINYPGVPSRQTVIRKVQMRVAPVGTK